MAFECCKEHRLPDLTAFIKVEFVITAMHTFGSLILLALSCKKVQSSPALDGCPPTRSDRHYDSRRIERAPSTEHSNSGPRPASHAVLYCLFVFRKFTFWYICLQWRPSFLAALCSTHESLSLCTSDSLIFSIATSRITIALFMFHAHQWICLRRHDARAILLLTSEM